jgi:hypothetical protein
MRSTDSRYMIAPASPTTEKKLMRIFKAIAWVVAAACISGTCLVAADAPFVGRWKLNVEKSDFGGLIVTIAEPSPGEYHISQADVTSTFKLDGIERPAAFGYTAIWKQVNERTWETTTKLNGRVVSTDRWSLSPDAQTLVDVTTNVGPGGKTTKDTTTFQRTDTPVRRAGSSGLTAAWKMEQLQVGGPNTVDIKADGADGLIIRFEPGQASCKAQFDGKPYPCEGQNIPPDFTLSLKRSGTDGFEATQAVKGKVVSSFVWRVSSDSRTLTQTGTFGADPASAQKVTAVFDRVRTGR